MEPPFILYRRPVPASARDAVLLLLPALAVPGRETDFLMLLLYYLLFTPLVPDAEGRLGILLPRTTLASILGIRLTSNFRAEDWLNLFSQRLFPLNHSDWSYTGARARMVYPAFPPAMLGLRDSMLARRYGTVGSDLVDWVTGEPVAAATYKSARLEYFRTLQRHAEKRSARHPAACLLDLLSGAAQQVLVRLLKRNWARLREAVLLLPATSEQERLRREGAVRVLLTVEQCAKIVYATSNRSPRVHAIGTTIHQLPRELREIALDGCVFLDLRSCQLALVAVLWNIPRLYRFLESRQSIWVELANHLKVGSEFKPLLKEVIYALVFGCAITTARKLLMNGNGVTPGVGARKAGRFLRHPLVQDLITARQRVMTEIRSVGGATDAFGRRISFSEFSVRSIMAQVVQSHELRIMLSIVPVLEQHRKVQLVSWLHDGIAVKIRDRDKAKVEVQALVDALDDAAARDGIPTEFEVTGLPE